MNWLHQALTDDRGEFDIAVIMTPVGVIGLLLISAYSVVVNKQVFNALEVGGGCAAIVSALFASKWGDAKVREATPPTLTTTTTTTATAMPEVVNQP